MESALTLYEWQDMKAINFFGAPGAGKSTAALGLASAMKRAWHNCEYVAEFAKDQVWAEAAHLLRQQNWVLGNQEFRLSVMRGKIDYAVVDGPLLLSAFYAPEHYPAAFRELCFYFFNSYDNINFFINRSHEYTGIGRLQNEQESDAIAERMKAFLRAHSVPFIEVTAGESAPGAIYERLESMGVIAPSLTQPRRGGG